MNLVGALLLGLLVGLTQRHPHPSWLVPLLGPGLLGGFTTFSAVTALTAAGGLTDVLATLALTLAGLAAVVLGLRLGAGPSGDPAAEPEAL